MKIFISYSFHDKPFADKLISRLRANNFFVYPENPCNVTGTGLREAITDAIKECDCCIPILSKSSAISAWANYEYSLALVYSNQQQHIKVIPLMLERCDMPKYFSHLAYINFTRDFEDAFSNLLKQLKGIHTNNYPSMDFAQLTAKSFENLVHELLIREGYQILVHGGQHHHQFDFLCRKRVLKSNRYVLQTCVVEAKFYLKSKLSIQNIAQLYGIAKLSNADVLILATNSTLTSSAREFLHDKISDVKIEVWDQTSLLELLKRHSEVMEKYFSCPPAKEHIDVSSENQTDEILEMIYTLDNCPPGKIGWRDYESICISILNYLFVPPLKQPTIQSRTDSGIDIRDAIYPNRCTHDNWRYVREVYDARYILFEFKNYSPSSNGSLIGKDEVNQVRNYLKQTIGKLGLICSTKVPSSNAYEAQKQAFIEDKKLIVFLTNDNLKEMLFKKYNGEDPSDVIVDLIDNFNLTFGARRQYSQVPIDRVYSLGNGCICSCMLLYMKKRDTPCGGV